MSNKEAMHVIEWNQKSGHFHICDTTQPPSRNPDYVEVQRVWGTFADASIAASEWLDANPKAKAAYKSPFRGMEAV